VLALAVALAALFPAPAAMLAPADASIATLRVRPAVEGVPLVLDGRRYVTDARGFVTVEATDRELADDWALLRERLRLPETSVAPDRRVRFGRWVARTPTLVLLAPVRVLLGDPEKRVLDPSVAPRVVVRGTDGTHASLPAGRTSWLPAVRPVVDPEGRWSRRRVSYAIQEARVHGANVVNRNQQRFTPAAHGRVVVDGLFFAARFAVTDALFGGPRGRAVRLRFPDGHTERFALDPGGRLIVEGLPRGNYEVSVDAAGLAFAQPISLSRSQDVRLRVISRLDIAVVGGALLLAALLLALAHRALGRRARARAAPLVYGGPTHG
jgi:hypothetical protein